MKKKESLSSTIYKTTFKIQNTKMTCPGQNIISLSNKDLSPVEEYLLRKGPSFIPTPTRNFDKFLGNPLIKARFTDVKFKK